MTRFRLRIGPWLGVALLGLALGGAPSTGVAAEAQQEPIGVVDVNRADVDELVRLPGIGEAKARAIVDERERRGGFRSVDDLLEVRGIGEAALERMRPHVKVGRATRRAAE